MEAVTACQRCGSVDGTHVGYHSHDELPIKAGDRVVLRVGAQVEARGKVRVLKRRQVVTVNHVDNGSSRLEGEWIHLADPDDSWVGSGGYWHSAKLDGVESK